MLFKRKYEFQVRHRMLTLYICIYIGSFIEMGTDECEDSSTSTSSFEDWRGFNLLFDLNTDCHETVNIFNDSSSSEYEEVVTAMWVKIDSWKNHLGSPEIASLE